MTKQLHSPEPEEVKQTVAKLREICTLFDEQILVLDELIAQLEAEEQNNPLNQYRRQKGMERLQAYPEHQSKIL